MAGMAFQYVKKQLENSLRVKKPSQKFMDSFSIEFLNFQLLSNFYGINTVKNRVKIDKKASAFVKAANFEPESFFAL